MSCWYIGLLWNESLLGDDLLPSSKELVGRHEHRGNDFAEFGPDDQLAQDASNEPESHHIVESEFDVSLIFSMGGNFDDAAGNLKWGVPFKNFDIHLFIFNEANDFFVQLGSIIKVASATGANTFLGRIL